MNHPKLRPAQEEVYLVILTEKPSVAKDFASALGCRFSSSEKCYKSTDGKTIITNCVGHLFILAEPVAYSPSFKSWKNLPVIPDEFIYEANEKLKSVSDSVVSILKKHKNDEILIATDADREGEIIARECLNAAQITDYGNIRRFWVSQALTKEVILSGIRNAKPIAQYDALAAQGFARQKADWLVGINASRFITNRGKGFFPVGRVQTAVLAELAERCSQIENFKSEKYFEFKGTFTSPDGTSAIKAVYSDGKNSRFKDKSAVQKLDSLCGMRATVSDLKKESRSINPPQLYNLNDLQKDAFTYFGYSAEKTLAIVQKLYEAYKCVSYPRTPSKVMGSGNIELCKSLFCQMLRDYPEYFELHSVADVYGENKRVFDDTKLEAHHALIPLDKAPASLSADEENIYSLILERFMLVFAPVCETENITAIISVDGNSFEARGTKVLSEGWKQYRRFTQNLGKKSEQAESQDLGCLETKPLILKSVYAEEKRTKPPKHYNEASLLAFMENPKNSGNQKLAGLGTAATRHTFIPKLEYLDFVAEEKKNLIVTEKGKKLLSLLSESQFKSLADISETTRWEEELSEQPEKFLEEIKTFIRESAGGAA